jgi:hypothetical protein
MKIEAGSSSEKSVITSMASHSTGLISTNTAVKTSNYTNKPIFPTYITLCVPNVPSASAKSLFHCSPSTVAMLSLSNDTISHAEVTQLQVTS